MSRDRQKEIRKAFHTFKNLEKVFQGRHDRVNIDADPVDQLEDYFKHFEDVLNDLGVPRFNKEKFFSHRDNRDRYYKIDGCLSHLSSVLGILKVEIDDESVSPVTESRDFSFVSDSELRKIVERDYQEVQKAFISSLWKSTIILCGGLIEALLIDAVKSSNKTSSKSPSKPDVLRWDLGELIDVAVDLEIVGLGIEKLSHSVREFRNLVHPGREMREKLSFDSEEARIAIEVLNMTIRDLQ